MKNKRIAILLLILSMVYPLITSLAVTLFKTNLRNNHSNEVMLNIALFSSGLVWLTALVYFIASTKQKPLEVIWIGLLFLTGGYYLIFLFAFIAFEFF